MLLVEIGSEAAAAAEERVQKQIHRTHTQTQTLTLSLSHTPIESERDIHSFTQNAKF